MDRRKFFSAAGAAGLAASAAAPATAAPGVPGGACASAKLPPLKARLGHQFGALTDQTAAWVSRFGVDAICSSPRSPIRPGFIPRWKN